jgi:hypothetical protein
VTPKILIFFVNQGVDGKDICIKIKKEPRSIYANGGRANNHTFNIWIIMNAIKDVDAVIQLAAIIGDPISALGLEETIEINYLSSKILAEVCKKSRRFYLIR